MGEIQMFGFLKKAEVNEEKVNAFADWFLENGDRIIASVNNRMQDRQAMMTVLDEVEEQLAKVYRDGYKGQIEFDYGGKDDDWTLNLYHKNKPFSMQATEMIADRINEKRDPKWKVRVGK